MASGVAGGGHGARRARVQGGAARAGPQHEGAPHLRRAVAGTLVSRSVLLFQLLGAAL